MTCLANSDWTAPFGVTFRLPIAGVDTPAGALCHRHSRSRIPKRDACVTPASVDSAVRTLTIGHPTIDIQTRVLEVTESIYSRSEWMRSTCSSHAVSLRHGLTLVPSDNPSHVRPDQHWRSRLLGPERSARRASISSVPSRQHRRT